MADPLDEAERELLERAKIPVTIRPKPDSEPPAPSTRRLQRDLLAWLRARWWAAAIVFATGGTAGLSRLPWGDWLGLATRAEAAVLEARIAKLEADRARQVKALAAVKASCASASEVAALKSQVNGLLERQDSVEVKPKKRR
jgi:uncharacterized coiled-coil protein SlyX